MTYYDSADEVKITKSRALSEIRNHGITDDESIAYFFTSCGEKEEYLAQEVLDFLGY